MLPNTMGRVIRRPYKALVRFSRSKKGSVTVLFGLMAIALFSMIGLAVDLGRWVNARDHTISAIDASVLAAGRALQTGSSAEDAKDLARTYYQNAIANRIKTVDDAVNFQVIENGLAVTATGNAHLKTPFMAMLGYRELPLLRQSGAEHDGKKGSDMSVARIAVGGQSGSHVETVVMLDVSGSMHGSKLNELKEAAEDLVNIVVWDDQSEYQSRVALVPFAADVRPPPNWLKDLSGKANAFQRDKWGNSYKFAPTVCVAERGGSEAYTDAAPSANALLTRVHKETGSGNNKTASCYIHEKAGIEPLTNNKRTLLGTIDDLVAQSGTAGHVGTAWAFYMLSPEWGDIVGESSRPRAYNLANNRKVAVLMTDGEYNFTYDADGGPSSASGGSGSSGLGSINGKSSAAQAKLICDNMKAKGIEIFTIGFELGNNQTAQSTMSHCASSDDHYYPADDGTELKNAFRDIALQISKLYLSN